MVDGWSLLERALEVVGCFVHLQWLMVGRY
jgi:hypothetical protein